MAESQLSQELQQWSLLHFEKGVPICDINIRKENKDRLARVSHVYWLWKKNPFLDADALLRQLVRGKFADAPSECHAAYKDKALFDFVVDHVSPPSRKVAEAKVRVVADRLMQNGMSTDNGKDMAEGAKILMKLDRLDQPETEQMDMAKTVFLPPLVTTVASDIDPTKKNTDDEQAKAIMQKYGAYIDVKRTMVEERVNVMLAARGSDVQEAAEVVDTD